MAYIFLMVTAGRPETFFIKRERGFFFLKVKGKSFETLPAFVLPTTTLAVYHQNNASGIITWRGLIYIPLWYLAVCSRSCTYRSCTAESCMREGAPDSHQEFSLHLLSILHMETSRLVHSNCLLLLTQPSCQRLLASTSKQRFQETQHERVTWSECGKSHPTSASSTASHDAVVRFKATACKGGAKCVSTQTDVHEAQRTHHCVGGCEQVVMDW